MIGFIFLVIINTKLDARINSTRAQAKRNNSGVSVCPVRWNQSGVARKQPAKARAIGIRRYKVSIRRRRFVR